MNRRKAKKLINELINTLNEHNIKDQFWMDKVQAYVQAIFGDKEQSIALPMFGSYYWDRPYNERFANREQLIVSRLKSMFDSYLVMIDNGVFIRRNMFTNFNNWTIISIMAGIVLFFIGIIGTLSYNQGICNSELEKVKLYLEGEKSKDTVRMLKIQVATLRQQILETRNVKKPIKPSDPNR